MATRKAPLIESIIYPATGFWKRIPRAPLPSATAWISLLTGWTRCVEQPFWKAIQDVCSHRKWNLLAAHVPSTHVHTVVNAEIHADRVMIDFKAYASRRLNEMRLDGPVRKRWARHGSTRWLFNSVHVSMAIQYVVNEQGGSPMSVFESSAR